METVIREYLGQIKVGRKQSYNNLALFPLLSTYRAALDYVTLDDAFAENLVEVAEMGREGTVPEIKVTNKSPRRLLILDGEELVGAKQNRIVNTTILLEAPLHYRHSGELRGAGKVVVQERAVLQRGAAHVRQAQGHEGQTRPRLGARDHKVSRNTEGNPMGHVVLLGDSIFDNAARVAGSPDVRTQVQD